MPGKRAAPEVSAEVRPRQRTDGPHRLLLTWGDGATDTVVWTCQLAGMIGALDDLETDAALVHLRRNPAGRVAAGCALDATFIHPHAPLVRPSPEPIVF